MNHVKPCWCHIDPEPSFLHPEPSLDSGPRPLFNAQSRQTISISAIKGFWRLTRIELKRFRYKRWSPQVVPGCPKSTGARASFKKRDDGTNWKYSWGLYGQGGDFYQTLNNETVTCRMLQRPACHCPEVLQRSFSSKT